MIFWRRDGRELYYLRTDLETGDRLMMAVDVSTTPTFFAGTPRLLFKFPASLRFVGNLNQWKNVSGDGQRSFAVSVPASARADLRAEARLVHNGGGSAEESARSRRAATAAICAARSIMSPGRPSAVAGQGGRCVHVAEATRARSRGVRGRSRAPDVRP
jgi:hypothetical protein